MAIDSHQLKQAVQGSKQVNLRFNLAEIATLAGISKRTAQNKNKEIESYWHEQSLTPNEDKEFVFKKGIEFGIQKLLTEDEVTLEEIFGIILGTYLKVETNILENVSSLTEVRTIGKHLTKVFRFVCNYKNDKGVPIHSNNQSSKYILNKISEESLDKLFIRSRNYIPGKRSKRWKETEILSRSIKRSIYELLNRLSRLSGSKFNYISSHMYPQKDAKRTSNNNYIYINIDSLRDFEINSVFSLLIRTIEIRKDEIVVPVIHEACTNELLGRSYNVFCKLRSKERLQLGYISYDMNAALQSISLHLVKAIEKDYPILWSYTHNKEHKRKIRTDIAQTLAIDVSEVKAKLTAFANGSVSDIELHEYYKNFQEESDRLRKSVLKQIHLTEPEVLERAREQSKREFPEELDWSDTESEETLAEIRNKASVFFFAWTWYERLIRQAMLMVLPDGIEVHDAVYSKLDIDPKIVEQKIYDQTEFNIVIEKEKP